MSDAVRYEWMRIRTLRSTYWLIGLSLFTTAAVALILGFVSGDDPLTDSLAGLVLLGGGESAAFIPILMAIIGIMATGHEYRYGLIQPTLTALPQRTTLLAAKLYVVAMVAIGVVLASLAINLVIALVFWGELPALGSDPLNQVIPGYFVLVVLYAVLGAGLALLFRGVPSAIVVLLVTPMIVETLIASLAMVPALDWLVPAVKFLPFMAGDRLISIDPGNVGGAADFNLLDRWPSGGVFALFVIMVVGVAWLRFRSRDA